MSVPHSATGAHGAAVLQAPRKDMPEQNMLAPLRRLFAATVVLILAAAVIYSMLAWNQVRRDQLAKLQHFSEIIARSSGKAFDAYLLSLRWFAPRLVEPMRDGRVEDVNRLLREYQASDATVVGVTVLAPDGLLVASTLARHEADTPFNVKALTAGASDGFKQMLDGGGPMVTQTILPHLSKEWAIPLRYPVRDDAGNLRFIVSVLLSTERLGKTWQALSAPDGTVFLLARSDGHRQLRVPAPANPEAFYGKPSNTGVAAAMMATPGQRSGVYEANRTTDATSAIGAYTRLDNYPLAAAVSVPQRQLWMAWMDQVTVPLGVFAALLLGLVAANANARAIQNRISREQGANADMLRDIEKHVSLALEGAALATWDWRALTGTVYLSRRWSSMLGGEPEPTHATVEELLQLVHPSDIETLKSKMAAALKGQVESYHGEHRVRTRRGEWLWIESQGRVVERDSSGRAVRVAGTNADITERKQAEEDQRRLASIVENANVAIFSRTLDGIVLTWNPGAEKLLGYTAAEAIGQSITFIVPPGRPANLARNNESLLRGEVVTRESHRLTKDGSVIDVLASHSPIRDSVGNIVGASVIIQDITALRQTQAVLKESEERFRDLTELSSDWSWEQDREFRFVGVSAGAASLHGGISREAHYGKTRWELPGTDVVNTTWAAHQAQLRAHLPFRDLLLRRVGRDGEEHYIQVSGKPVFDAAGVFCGYRGVASDVSGKLNIENELRESDARLRAAFDQAAVGMGLRTVKDVNSRWLRVNRKLCEMFGYTEAEMLSLTTEELTPTEEWRLAITSRMKLISDEAGTATREKRYRRKDGSIFWGLITLSAVRDRVGTPIYYVSIIHDITDRKLHEQERRKYDRNQRQAFVREVHHRIKNHVQGVAGLLLRRAQLQPALADEMKVAVAQLQSVAVVHGLQGSSGTQPTLGEMVPAICEAVQGYAAGRVKIVIKSTTRMAVAVSEDEAVPIALIVNELLMNAVKHTLPTDAEQVVAVHLDEGANEVRLTITNPGVLPSGFDTQRSALSGSGLRIVRSLLPLSGARLDIATVGNSVRVTLELRAPVIVLVASWAAMLKASVDARRLAVNPVKESHD